MTTIIICDVIFFAEICLAQKVTGKIDKMKLTSTYSSKIIGSQVGRIFKRKIFHVDMLTAQSIQVD